MNKLKKFVKNVLKAFYITKVKNNRLFCISFEGGPLGYDGKAFIDWIYNNKKSKYDIIWGIKDKSYKQKYKDVRFIRIKSLKGIYYLLTSKVVLCNINPPSYIPFRKSQIIINTWHGGGAIKKCGKYLPNFNKEQFNTSTCFVSSSEIATKAMIRDAFAYEGEVLSIGLPRSDVFFNKDEIEKRKRIIKEKYNIPNKCKILLYEPTFRGNFELKQNTIDFETVIKELNKKFNSQFVLIYRLHPMIAQDNKLNIDSAVDASLYPDNQDLLCSADVFITDYSSGVWELLLKSTPIFIYADDIDTYDRLYYHYSTWPYSVARNNNELIDNINLFDNKVYIKKVDKYLKDMGNFETGNSCEKLYKYIEKNGFQSIK